MSSGASDPAPNHDEAVAFLARFAPGGPWVLVAIAVDQKSIVTRTFREPAEIRSWLSEHGDRNIYFHVNPVLRDLDRKAGREDVASLAWLHVDIDPRSGDLEREQALTRHRLSAPRGSVPPPTVIIFSGGGYQGFWKLATPLPINGSVDAAEDAKLWNLQLELIFGADQCHNVDRIMRLPGTVNWPTTKKRRKGRAPALASLVEFHDDRVYDLSAFTKATPRVQTAAPAGVLTSPAASPAPGNVRRLASVDELDDWSVPVSTKVLIVQGCNPEDPTQHQSRSEALFAACCGMVRSNVPDDIIYAVITDPDFQISASVLDKGPGIDRYAMRQIARAHEEATAPWLREMNERYAVVWNMGIVEEIEDEWGRPILHFLDKEELFDRYANKMVVTGADPKKGDIKMQQGKAWWTHPSRMEYQGFIFKPGADDVIQHGDRHLLNEWRGFSVPAAEGDCSLYLAHLRDTVCSGNEEYFEWLLSWMAYAVQHPDRPGHVAVVLRGGRGIGKGQTILHFGNLFGDRHFLQEADPERLVGRFNASLSGKVILFADEAFYAANHKHEAILKSLITEPRIRIERKGLDPTDQINRLHIMMASNAEWVVPAGIDERRFFVLNVAEGHAKETAYFKRLAEQMRDGGSSALLFLLLNRPLADFDVRNCPETAALIQQKEATIRKGQPALAFVLDVLRSGEVPWPFRGTKDAFRRIFHAKGRRYFVSYPEMAMLISEIQRCPVSPDEARDACRVAGFLADRSRLGGEADDEGGRVRRNGVWIDPIELDEYRRTWDAESGMAQATWPAAKELTVPEEGKGSDRVEPF